MRRLSRERIEAMSERAHRHQFNDNAVRMTRTLGTEVGLRTVGVHLIRLEPGRDSTQFHYHDSDEEFVYVLAGRGTAFIGDARFTVTAGDFMGFPSPSPGHGLTNDADATEDLVYLVGGESNPADVVHYPWIRRTMIKSHGHRAWVDWDHLHDL
ncbi:MAG: cupin domain-containing protein [Pseudomonadales bacterium]